jgi:hypothetical protein
MVFRANFEYVSVDIARRNFPCLIRFNFPGSRGISDSRAFLSPPHALMVFDAPCFSASALRRVHARRKWNAHSLGRIEANVHGA